MKETKVMNDKMILSSMGTSREISFHNEAFLTTPKTLNDWLLIYAGYYMADNGEVIDDVDLYFQGKHYWLNDEGQWEEQ